MLSLVIRVVIPLSLIGISLWRLPAAVRSGRASRSLTLCVGALGLALLTSYTTIDDGPLHHAVHNLPVLLRHLIGMASIALLLDYLYLVHGSRVRGRLRPSFAVTAVAGAAMSVIFFVLLPRADTPDAAQVIVDHQGELWVTIYQSIFYAFLGTSMCAGTVVFWSARKAVPRGLLRAGVFSLAAGCVFGVLYTVLHVLIMAATTAGIAYTPAMDRLSDLTVSVSILLIIIGLAVSPVPVLVRYVRDQRAIWRMYPLWQALTGEFPSLVMGEWRSRWRELFRTGDRTIDVAHMAFSCRDGMKALEPWADPAAVRPATIGADAVTDALWVRAAIYRKASGEASPAKPGTTFEEQDLRAPAREVEWAVAVAGEFGKASS
ncbi:MAB_1171c family putative transporter [Kitasatospora sp. NPDC058478]|uniref:MAB_1171c family putative transporter n=1 Tax=unclassified Kitasatospora TaxID=2633591 RepID=UPI003650FD02